MNDKLHELKSRLREASDLNSAASVLYWDQSTYMPPGGAEARGCQMAALRKLAQERFTAPAVESEIARGEFGTLHGWPATSTATHASSPPRS